MKINMIELTWARPWIWFTLLFEMMSLELIKHMSLTKVWEHLQENSERLMRIATYYVNKSKEKAYDNNIKQCWIRWNIKKKWNNYLTIFINFETKKVSPIVEWKWKASKDIEEYWLHRRI